VGGYEFAWGDSKLTSGYEKLRADITADWFMDAGRRERHT